MRNIIMGLLLSSLLIQPAIAAPTFWEFDQAVVLGAYQNPDVPSERIFYVEVNGTREFLRCKPSDLLHCNAVVKDMIWSFAGKFPAADQDPPLYLIVTEIRSTQDPLAPLGPAPSFTCGLTE